MHHSTTLLSILFLIATAPTLADDSGFRPENLPSVPAMVLVHGGAGTLPSQSGQVAIAAEAGWNTLEAGGSAVDAAVAAAMVLEDDPDFNAGTGSNIRMDGETVQMDAAVMNDRGDFGAVAVIQRVKNPVLVAREVMKSPHLILAGEGATRFARSLGLSDYDPRAAGSLQRYEHLRRRMVRGELERGWDRFDWKQHWNFPGTLPPEFIPRDTIGVVVSDGTGGFAAAQSTGGTTTTLHGRIGDVPLMGAGAFVGVHGAVCATGWGEYIVRENLSRRVYDWMATGQGTESAVNRGLKLFPDHLGMGLIAVSPQGYAAVSNTTMAWAGIVKGNRISATQPTIGH